MELEAARGAPDDEIICNAQLIPAYNYIRSLRDSINFVMHSRGKRLTLNLDWLKKCHQMLLPEDRKDQIQYRKDNLIHRPYFHELAAPDQSDRRDPQPLCVHVERRRHRARMLTSHVRVVGAVGAVEVGAL